MKSNTENLAYNEATIARIVEFKDMYPNEDIPTLESLLQDVSRKDGINISQTLLKSYVNANFDGMQNFFSWSNDKDDFEKRFANSEKLNKESSIFCTNQTAIELLKFIYSLPYKLVSTPFSKNEYSDIEKNIFKAMLVINTKLMSFVHERKSAIKQQIAELMLVNSFSQKDINEFDLKKAYQEIISKTIDAFDYFANSIYFKPIYEEFLKRTGIDNYQTYVRTILGLAALFFNEGYAILKNDIIEQTDSRIMNRSVLDYLSIPVDENIEFSKNVDYVAFRDKPLIKYPDGSYRIINVQFLLERLYNSLYFEFKDIAKDLEIKGSFVNEYTSEFSEKHLLELYLTKSGIETNYDIHQNGGESLGLAKKGEDGEPDYYLRKTDKNRIILFENKDILINAETKQSRNFEETIAEYKNKLLLKTYKMSNGEKVDIKNPKPIGIGQLVTQIKKIQDKNAFWDKEASIDSMIYPVLVLSNSNILPDGLPYLMQNWYEEECKNRSVKIEYARPLIVMSIATILLYSEEFAQHGFEYYFDLYYKSLEDSKKSESSDLLLAVANESVSFDDYMKKVHNKSFENIFNSYKDKIFNME